MSEKGRRISQNLALSIKILMAGCHGQCQSKDVFRYFFCSRTLDWHFGAGNANVVAVRFGKKS